MATSFKSELFINLNGIDKVKNFVNKMTCIEYNADLSSGRYIVDAKSLMGIFSLDLSKSVKLTLHAGEEESKELLSWLSENNYVVEG